MNAVERLGSNVLLRSSNWLGDAIMTMPAVCALAQQLSPNARLSILAPPKLHEVWKLVPNVAETLPATPNLFETARLLKKRRFTSAVILPNSLRSALEVFLAGIPLRFGYKGHARRFLLTSAFSKIIPPSGIQHQKIDYLQLMRLIGLDVSDEAGLPVVARPLPPSLSEPFLVVCPGAEFGPAKRWPAERFAEAADNIAVARGWRVVLLGARADEAQAAAVEKKIRAPHLNLAGKTTLAELVQWLAHARLVLCNDSGAMHLAALLRAPTVAIFGSTEPRLTGPLSPTVRVLREHVPCSPCFLRRCPLDFRCMNNVAVEQVVRADEEILAR
ncbi:MAG: lipopolysaccharide heptosyltransferase II [bacterium]